MTERCSGCNTADQILESRQYKKRKQEKLDHTFCQDQTVWMVDVDKLLHSLRMAASARANTFTVKDHINWVKELQSVA
jgi:hypothetical protein